jgi:hypothetical protein
MPINESEQQACDFVGGTAVQVGARPGPVPRKERRLEMDLQPRGARVLFTKTACRSCAVGEVLVVSWNQDFDARADRQANHVKGIATVPVWRPAQLAGGVCEVKPQPMSGYGRRGHDARLVLLAGGVARSGRNELPATDYVRHRGWRTNSVRIGKRPNNWMQLTRPARRGGIAVLAADPGVQPTL